MYFYNTNTYPQLSTGPQLFTTVAISRTCLYLSTSWKNLQMGRSWKVLQKVKCDPQEGGRHWCVIEVKGLAQPCDRTGGHTHWTDSCCGPSVGFSLRPFHFSLPSFSSSIHQPPSLTTFAPTQQGTLDFGVQGRTQLVTTAASRVLCLQRAQWEFRGSQVWSEWESLCLHVADWHGCSTSKW